MQGGIDGRLRASALADGHLIWRAQVSASVSGGTALGNGMVVVGVGTPAFAPFVHPGNAIVAFYLAAASPVASPVASPGA